MYEYLSESKEKIVQVQQVCMFNNAEAVLVSKFSTG